jgi:NAD-dependent dihydropyrimidine dehydrogenase PreA subunit
MIKEVTPVTGPTVVVHAERCKGCGRCIDACPNQVLAFAKSFNSRGYMVPEARPEGCTGCGACFYTCPEPGGITVYKKPAKRGEG